MNIGGRLDVPLGRCALIPLAYTVSVHSLVKLTSTTCFIMGGSPRLSFSAPAFESTSFHRTLRLLAEVLVSNKWLNTPAKDADRQPIEVWPKSIVYARWPQSAGCARERRLPRTVLSNDECVTYRDKVEAIADDATASNGHPPAVQPLTLDGLECRPP